MLHTPNSTIFLPTTKIMEMLGTKWAVTFRYKMKVTLINTYSYQNIKTLFHFSIYVVFHIS